MKLETDNNFIESSALRLFLVKQKNVSKLITKLTVCLLSLFLLLVHAAQGIRETPRFILVS
jgi:hypothetical protein